MSQKQEKTNQPEANKTPAAKKSSSKVSLNLKNLNRRAYSKNQIKNEYDETRIIQLTDGNTKTKVVHVTEYKNKVIKKRLKSVTKTNIHGAVAAV